MDPQWAGKAEALIAAAFEKAGADPGKAIKVYDGLLIASAWSFIFGLGFLVTFAIRNLPFEGRL